MQPWQAISLSLSPGPGPSVVLRMSSGLSAKGKPIRDVGPFLQSFFSLSISHSVYPRLAYPFLLSSPLRRPISPPPPPAAYLRTPLRLTHSLSYIFYLRLRTMHLYHPHSLSD